MMVLLFLMLIIVRSRPCYHRGFLNKLEKSFNFVIFAAVAFSSL